VWAVTKYKLNNKLKQTVTLISISFPSLLRLSTDSADEAQAVVMCIILIRQMTLCDDEFTDLGPMNIKTRVSQATSNINSMCGNANRKNEKKLMPVSTLLPVTTSL